MILYKKVEVNKELPTQDDIYFVWVEVEGILFPAVGQYDPDKEEWNEYLEVTDSSFKPVYWLKKLT